MGDWADANPTDPSTWPIEWISPTPDPLIATIRAAQGVRDLYMAYVHVGFDAEQALRIVIALLSRPAAT